MTQSFWPWIISFLWFIRPRIIILIQALFASFPFVFSFSLKCRHKSTPWSRSDEDEEGEDDYTGSPSVEASAEQRMLAPSNLYKSSPLLDSSPATPKSPTTASIELHRQLLALRRGSRASRGSTGMIEMVEDALGGTVVPPNVAANGGSGSMDARYRKWQTRLYNFLERPRGSKAIAYHVVVWVEFVFFPSPDILICLFSAFHISFRQMIFHDRHSCRRLLVCVCVCAVRIYSFFVSIFRIDRVRISFGRCVRIRRERERATW